MKGYKCALIMVLLVLLTGIPLTTLHAANTVDGTYVRFAVSKIATHPGDHARVIVQYGNTTNAAIHVSYMTCAFSYQYGTVGSIYQGYFATAYRSSGKFLLSAIFQDHLMAPHQSTSVSFYIDVTPDTAILHEGQPTTVTCDLHLDDGSVKSASVPIVGPFTSAG